MGKKAEVNWFIIMAVLALATLLILMFISGGVFSKFMGSIGLINNDITIKNKCMATADDTDVDNDGYKKATITVDGKTIVCDSDDNDPEKYYGKGDDSED
ncbi:hypothetical protein JXB31_02445 [Candidatus Woesearchaeota archaeon]|nr:hypothetical protein [Candidatus Woesearchaeota archaeon]